MYLKTLHLREFRNYRDRQVEFGAPKTILVGDNAQGKSNLLEGAALLSTLKSHRSTSDRDLIREGAELGQATGIVDRQIAPVELSVTLRRTGRRTLTVDGQGCRRQLDFLGIFNVVEFSSLDLDLVRGSPESRRHWLDGLVVQLEPFYAHLLKQYDRVLRQRNALLRKIRESFSPMANRTDPSQQMSDSALPVLDAQLATLGTKVMRRRSRAIERLTPIARAWHDAIGGGAEQLSIRYASNISLFHPSAIREEPEVVRQGFLDLIREKAIAEYHRGTTLVGPHRDEIAFSINETPARQYASQGQQRTLVLALKLAQLKLIEEVVGEPPVLLLDDVLAELDPNRQNQLLEAIEDRFQTLITTTHLGAFDAQWLKTSQILGVRAGEICSQGDFSP
ncbi:DNA replication/repair protein RecF [Oscillatoriales cyanobacterium LEGE 11467]|uniref:DNA replication and repair protein RecF n=1 Tax=Zarconia navalis LEGE 11467 TaxID=1828826 RepID=A0A928VW70_9CYAN|nr:DNA replication/repair protein RecF [Zarconia navalis]MBE9039857.1 DNA replication/repair protein RecF [Zarconia navalis LEGE 11467]